MSNAKGTLIALKPVFCSQHYESVLTIIGFTSYDGRINLSSSSNRYYSFSCQFHYNLRATTTTNTDQPTSSNSEPNIIKRKGQLQSTATRRLGNSGYEYYRLYFGSRGAARVWDFSTTMPTGAATIITSKCWRQQQIHRQLSTGPRRSDTHYTIS